MRRTQERSQRVEQRQKRWSWGGLTDSEGRTGTFALLSKNSLMGVKRTGLCRCLRRLFSCASLNKEVLFVGLDAETA